LQLLNSLKRLALALTIITTSLFVALPAQAGMVGTASLGSSMHLNTGIETVAQQRQWIQIQLETNGVESAEAALRVSSLTDAQVQQIHQRIDEMPAGSGALGTVAFIFLVLVITDLTGLTDVFW
jgi:hypothetical protein